MNDTNVSVDRFVGPDRIELINNLNEICPTPSGLSAEERNAAFDKVCEISEFQEKLDQQQRLTPPGFLRFELGIGHWAILTEKENIVRFYSNPGQAREMFSVNLGAAGLRANQDLVQLLFHLFTQGIVAGRAIEKQRLLPLLRQMSSLITE
jgi:hypothetical protein